MLRPVAPRTSERRLHRVGAGRAAELHLGLAAQGVRQDAKQVLDEAVLHRRGQVQRVQRQFLSQHALDRLDHHRVVVTQGQRSSTGQAVDELAALDVLDVDAAGTLERQRDAPG